MIIRNMEKNASAFMVDPKRDFIRKCEYKAVQIEVTPFQQKLVQELSDKADAINGGNVDPSINNMLQIFMILRAECLLLKRHFLLSVYTRRMC